MSEPRKSKPGRPTKRTPETQRKICEFLRTGLGRVDAAVASGISRETFAHWMNEFSDFSDIVLRAESEAAARFTAIVAKAAIDDWRAASWWLERKRNSEFGNRQRIDIKQIDDETLIRLLEETEERTDSEGA